MAFPTVPTTGNGRLLSQNQNNATSPRTFPSLTSLTKNAGDLLLAIVVAYERGAAGATFSSWGASFTERADIDGGANLPAFGIASKVSDGTETGTFTVAQAGVVGHCSLFLLSIAGGGPIQIDWTGTVATGTAAAADPASLNPANWDAEDTLWISVAMNGETNTGGAWSGLGTPTAPTNYTSLNSPGIGTDAVGGIHSAIAFRQNNTAAEDVGTWTGQDTSNARNAAIVIAVRPLLVPTGVGIRGNSGDGHVPGTRARAGRGVLGRIVYAGSGISANVGSGADVVEFVETGSGISANVGSGVSQKVAGGASNEKLGAGIRDHVGAATDAVVFDELGTSVSARIGSGADVTAFAEAGTGTSVFVGSGADVVEFVEAGSGITARIGAGSKEISGGVTYEKTGLGRLGSGAITSAKEGVGIRGHVGAAADAVEFAEAGSGITGRVGAGTSQKVGDNSKTGAGVRDHVGSGTDAVEFAKLGTSTSARIGSGADVTEFTESGLSVSARIGSGADAVEFVEAGSGITGRVGSGVKEISAGITYTKAGVGRLGLEYAPVTEGAGVRGHVGSGVAVRIGEPTGTGTSARIGSATDAVTYIESGSGIGGNPPIDVDSGAGVRGHVGAGASAKVSGGNDKTGAGVRGHSAAATDQAVFTESGTGIEPHAGSAQDAATFVESGAGVLPHVGSGSSFRGAGYEKTGTATSARTASGADVIVYGEAGSSIHSRIGTGADSTTYIETGAGVRDQVSSGEKYKLGEFIKFGGGVSARVASGVALVDIQLPPGGSVTAATSGRFPRGKRGSLTNTRQGGVLTG